MYVTSNRKGKTNPIEKEIFCTVQSFAFLKCSFNIEFMKLPTGRRDCCSFRFFLNLNALLAVLLFVEWIS